MGCKYVDEVIWEDVELVVTKEFIKKQYVSQKPYRRVTD
jgi:hypothetical protein